MSPIYSIRVANIVLTGGNCFCCIHSSCFVLSSDGRWSMQPDRWRELQCLRRFTSANGGFVMVRSGMIVFNYSTVLLFAEMLSWSESNSFSHVRPGTNCKILGSADFLPNARNHNHSRYPRRLHACSYDRTWFPCQKATGEIMEKRIKGFSTRRQFLMYFWNGFERDSCSRL